MTNHDPLYIDVADMMRELHCSRNTLANYRRQPTFPDPVRYVGSGKRAKPLWRYDHFVEWCRRTEVETEDPMKDDAAAREATADVIAQL